MEWLAHLISALALTASGLSALLTAFLLRQKQRWDQENKASEQHRSNLQAMIVRQETDRADTRADFETIVKLYKGLTEMDAERRIAVDRELETQKAHAIKCEADYAALEEKYDKMEECCRQLEARLSKVENGGRK